MLIYILAFCFFCCIMILEKDKVINMNFYDKIHEMVRALKQTNEFTDYMKLKEELKKDEKSYNMLKDFKDKQKKYQMEYIDGKEKNEAELNEMQNLYSLVIQNDISRKLLENEMKINVMLADMQKTVGDALKDIIDF